MPDGSSSLAPATPIPKRNKPHASFHFAAGLASGVSSSVLLQPIDLLKTRVQQSRSHSFVPVLRALLNSPHPVASLWRGTLPSALRTGFGSALYFTTLSTLRQLVANNQALANNASGIVSGSTPSSTNLNTPALRSSSVLPKLSNTQNLITGATARVFAGFMLMPVTVIKVRYESDLYAYKSLRDASRDIIRREGLRGFFSGFGATAIRDAPYAGLYVVFYEAAKTRLSRRLSAAPDPASPYPNVNNSKTSLLSTPTTINASSSVFAAALATSLTNPFDAVKTRIQLQPQKYKNAFRAAALMLREDGPKAFFDGLGLRMSRKAVSSALAWTVYEELIGRAERKFAEAEDGKLAL